VAATPRGKSRGASRSRPLDRFIGVVVLLGLWEVVPRTGLVSSDAVPPLSEVASAFVDAVSRRSLWVALLETMQSWLIGLAISIVAGVLVGFLLGGIPVLRSLTASTVEFLRPIPSVALIPLAVLLYGTDIRSTLLLVIYASFWQVLIQVLYGVQDVDPVVLDTARSYGLRPLARVRHVTWPTALPYVMTGIRLAATVALVLTVTAELVIGGRGLGSEIAVAQSSGAVPSTYALVVLSGLLGVLVNLAVRVLERRVLAWHPSVREVAL
jgi:ABC-type nitrate/sulfonate/bicarbonate transport system permease component